MYTLEELEKKSTTVEITKRFDADVDRFSNLNTGQSTTLDASYTLDLMTTVAQHICPDGQNLLDLGSGAGNYTLKILEKIPGLHCTLLDLSEPMLQRAHQRIREYDSTAKITTIRGDMRSATLPDNHYDIVLAGAVLHHLRSEEDWEIMFEKLFRVIRPGGCLLVSDLITHEVPQVHQLIWEKYGDYLDSLGGLGYKHKVFSYIEKEDSPRSLNFQIEVLSKVGFKKIDILHKNLCFATYCAIKNT